MRLKIVHVINSLEFGGAEMMLGNLLARSDRDRFEPAVVALIDDMTLADRIEALGIPIHVIGMDPRRPDPRPFARLVTRLRRERPDLIQTWMDHSNLLGGLANAAAPRVPLVWGIHHANHHSGHGKRTTLLAVRACALASRRLPARIVYCSEASRSSYEAMGFATGRSVVIPNGFDTAAFRPDAAARAGVRAELGLGEKTELVGLVARFDPVKDHTTFLRAAALLANTRPGVRFLLCGQAVEPGNAALSGLLDELGLRERCHLLGPRRDVARIQASLDVATSSSITEAFPLTVGEAMACGVPCVATDVGDSSLIVGKAGAVVPPRDPEALAAAWRTILDLPAAARRELSASARRRIVDHYGLETIAARYETLYEQLCSDDRRKREVPETREPRAGRVGVPVSCPSEDER